MQSEFLYHLRDTVLLLGLDRRFADLLVNPDAIGEAEVENLQRYNCKLLNATRSRLLDLNTLAVVPRSD
jgi:hypothetical protein